MSEREERPTIEEEREVLNEISERFGLNPKLSALEMLYQLPDDAFGEGLSLAGWKDTLQMITERPENIALFILHANLRASKKQG
jgi:hypothetical protein